MCSSDLTAGADKRRGIRFGQHAICEQLVRDVERRGSQRAHVDLRTLSENNAIGVDKVNMPIANYIAGNNAGIGVMYAVQGGPGAVALLIKL